MKLINFTCKNCGANLVVNDRTNSAVCDYCGTVYKNHVNRKPVRNTVNNYSQEAQLLFSTLPNTSFDLCWVAKHMGYFDINGALNVHKAYKVLYVLIKAGKVFKVEALTREPQKYRAYCVEDFKEE